jgi:hypothetical protein
MSKKSVLFHIKSDDYFGSLATVISLMYQNQKSIDIKILEKIEKDLIFLQKNFKIIKK